MKTEDKTLRSLRSSARLSLIVVLLLAIADAGIYLLERKMNAAWFGGIIVTLVFLCIAVFANLYYRRKLRESKSDDQDASIRTVSSFIPGKDMFACCNAFRLQCQKNVWIVLLFCILAGSAAITLKSHDVKPDLPWWTFFPVTAGVTLLMLIFGSTAMKEELSFKRPDDLRLEIAKRNEDVIRVNADFMSGRAYSLFKGMMVIGMSYYVVYGKKTCYVGLLSELSSARITRHEIKRTSANPAIVRHWVTTMEAGKEHHYLCGGGEEAELIIDEFRKHGIEIGKLIEA